MSSRPEQPEPFLRGCVFPAVTDAPYPRADPAGAEYLPADVWDAAQLPVGVRLELAGNARTIRVWYKTTRASLGYRGESAGCSFVAYRAGQKVAAVEAVMGEGMAELVVSGRTDLPVTVYLPEGMQPLVTGVAGVEETMIPAPPQARWLAYGDAVTQGWLASAPAMAWPAVAGRKLGLDVCNLGYAGTARGESTSAVLLAETPAEVVSIAFGLNNWSRVPHTVGLMAEEVRCFLAIVRKGHPDVPIVVVSPTARPDAEDSPNRVGATLAELRLAMEEAVLDWIGEGDKKVYLVEGLSVVDPEDLEDGIYPGDEGHRRLAAAVAKVLVPHLSELQEAARIRWTRERFPALASAAAVSTAVEGPTAETALVDGGSFDLPLVDEMAVESFSAVVAPVDMPAVAPAPSAAALLDEEPLAAEAVAEAVADTGFEPVAEVPAEEAPVSGAWWVDQSDSLTGNVFDPTPPAGSPLEIDSLVDEPENVANSNLDLPDGGSLGRESLNNALLDALSSNGSASGGSALEDTPVDDSFADESFVGDPFNDEPYNDQSSADQPNAADPYGADQPYPADPYAADPYAADPGPAAESFVEDSLIEDSLVDAWPVDQGGLVEGSFAEYSSFDRYGFVDDSPVTDEVAGDLPVAPTFDEVPTPPVVVPTLEETLARAAAPAPVDPDPLADVGPVAAPPLLAPEFDDPSRAGAQLDAGQLDAGQLDAGQVDAGRVAPSSVGPPAAAVERAVRETAAAERAAVAVPSPTSALNGEVPVVPAAHGTAVASAEAAGSGSTSGRPTGTPTTMTATAPAPPVRRETGHVDIAVADMVVAALTLATNGADDVIYGHPAAPGEEFSWAEAADPGSF